MGIINVTEDSFFDQSRVFGKEQAIARAEEMIREGASFLDVGGESTRPGSQPVSVPEEIRRVVPVIRGIKEKHPEILVSVDTYNAETAKEALKAGVDIINDISGLTFDPHMAETAAAYHAPVIIMHINGRPDHMQDNPQYQNVVEEVYDFLCRQIDYAVSKNIGEDQIIIDLGIGFGKNYEHNIALLKNIDRFNDLEKPHLLAVSRKTFIGTALRRENPADRLFGTAAVTAYAAMKGLELARVHDVRPNLETARMIEALK